jgi:hypothetical protein
MHANNLTHGSPVVVMLSQTQPSNSFKTINQNKHSSAAMQSSHPNSKQIMYIQGIKTLIYFTNFSPLEAVQITIKLKASAHFYSPPPYKGVSCWRRRDTY